MPSRSPFSPDGQTLASGGNNKMVIVWDAVTGEQMRTLVGHEHQINSVAYSPDGQALASASHDNTIRLWDAGTGKQTRLIGPLSNYALSCNVFAGRTDARQRRLSRY